ncbi:unnamed protein product [Spirodela intermedia]|uniref:Uncharacterized protein n=1 Tax=Spirodela intermedia TaxID=51605 RepID=A0A7I8J925_SPIIN|nr:unnamed protein product [Spirodela intermedia]CAA6666491.1 unnamed protein product [Spirodela intermedia]
MEEDEAMRAMFPLSFGKKTKSTPNSASAAHTATRRVTTGPAMGSSSAAVGDGASQSAVSSRSKSWLTSLRNPNPSRGARSRDAGGGAEERDDEDERAGVGPEVGPPLPPGGDEEEEHDGARIGPPRPPPEEEEDGAMIGPPRPPPPPQEEEDDGEAMIGPPRPQRPSNLTDSESDDDSDREYVVSALAIDHSGSRVLSGSYDYSVRMYDFQGMNSKLQSFRQLEPSEGHQVRSISWSPTSDRFLCVTGSAQAKIYDRDGLTLGEFIKGDMYIRDLKNTKGHISGLTCGEWNPKVKETILTSSEDGSLRIWDMSDFKSQKQVVKPKLSRPARIPVTSCAWDFEGKRIVGGIGDGSIQIWALKPGWGSRPDIHAEKAHQDDITGLKFSTDGQILLSRSMDGTLKKPIKVFEDLPNNYPQTNAAFSPDEQLILTGTSVEKDGASGGLLCFFSRKKLELESRVGISPQLSVVRCAWHPKLNQVFATVGDKKEGGTHILYDPTMSKRGALVCVGRAPRKTSVDDFQAEPVIHNPHALPLFRDQPSRKRQREKMLKDPIKSHKPELPVTGPGFGGRVGSTKGSLLTQYLLKQGGLIKETWMDEDPREAILKYADVAAKDPKFIAPAYEKTQPEAVFAKSDSDEEDE